MTSRNSLEVNNSTQKLARKSSTTAVLKTVVDGDGREMPASEEFIAAVENVSNINDIVDQDETDLESIISNRLVPDFLCSIWFRIVVYLAVILNAVILGLETLDWFYEDYTVLTQVVKELTLAFFVCEILLKWYCGFWIFWKSNWNVVDFVIVALALIGPDFRFLSCGRVLRLLRACFMLRSVGTFDKIGILKELTTIIDSLLISLPDMINIALLMVLILLILAIAAEGLLGDAVPGYYGDLGSAFFSLFILTTQDGLVIEYNTFEEQSLWIRSVGAVFFVLAIMTGAFIFVNIIVAICCYNLEVACNADAKDKDDDVQDVHVHQYLTDDPSDDPATEFLEKMQYIGRSKAHKGISLIQLQKPFQLTDFSNLTVTKLEKYLLVLSALEENLAEYEDIKRDLEELYELVKNLNLLDVLQNIYSDSSYSMEPPGTGKTSVGSAQRGAKVSNHDMKQLLDMLKQRPSGRNLGAALPVSRASDDANRRTSASSDGSQARRRLSPSAALHLPVTRKLS